MDYVAAFVVALGITLAVSILGVILAVFCWAALRGSSFVSDEIALIKACTGLFPTGLTLAALVALFHILSEETRDTYSAGISIVVLTVVLVLSIGWPASYLVARRLTLRR
ncbi:MAG: hypothetical protein NBV60_01815 [Erythrobacter sp.]|nr:hypothetical protein [Erythrobacter sp.]